MRKAFVELQTVSQLLELQQMVRASAEAAGQMATAQHVAGNSVASADLLRRDGINVDAPPKGDSGVQVRFG